MNLNKAVYKYKIQTTFIHVCWQETNAIYTMHLITINKRGIAPPIEARANEDLGTVVPVARWSARGCAHLETANWLALDVMAARVILLARWCGRYVNM